MSNNRMSGKLIAALVMEGLEEIELVSPMDAISQAGGNCHIVSSKGRIRARLDRRRVWYRRASANGKARIVRRIVAAGRCVEPGFVTH